PAQPVRRVRGALARILLKPDEVFPDVAGNPGGSEPQPEIRGRSHRQREIPFWTLIGGLVEHIVVDADVRQRDRRIHVQRPYPKTHTRGIRLGVGRRLSACRHLQRKKSDDKHHKKIPTRPAARTFATAERNLRNQNGERPSPPRKEAREKNVLRERKPTE